MKSARNCQGKFILIFFLILTVATILFKLLSQCATGHYQKMSRAAETGMVKL